jgi:ATP synthase protein I
MVRQLSGATRGVFLSFDLVRSSLMGDDDAQGGRDQGPRPTTDSDLSERFRRLETQLDQKRPAAPPRAMTSGQPSSSPSAMGRAFRMSTEFVAGVLAGGALGYALDRVAGTRPWGLIVLLMLGFGAGVYNVMRASGFLDARSDAGSKPHGK